MCTTCGKMVHYQHWALHQRSHKRAEGADELYHYCDQGATCSDSRFYILILLLIVYLLYIIQLNDGP